MRALDGFGIVSRSLWRWSSENHPLLALSSTLYLSKFSRVSNVPLVTTQSLDA
uniref:Uncharacterized protein n=1 Tax=Manihot esculenta TaxID=3983 RepID=A0A2C9V770_MANES